MNIQLSTDLWQLEVGAECFRGTRKETILTVGAGNGFSEELIDGMGLEKGKAFWQWFSRWHGEGHKGQKVHA